MSACEETCVATRTLQGNKPVQPQKIGVRLEFRADSSQGPPTRCEIRVRPRFQAARFKFGTLAKSPSGYDQASLQSIHETSAWAPQVTLPGPFSRWSTARRV